MGQTPSLASPNGAGSFPSSIFDGSPSSDLTPTSTPIPLCALTHPSNLEDSELQVRLHRWLSFPVGASRITQGPDELVSTLSHALPMSISMPNPTLLTSNRLQRYVLQSDWKLEGRRPGRMPDPGQLDSEHLQCLMTSVSGCLSDYVLLGDLRGYVHLIPLPDDFTNGVGPESPFDEIPRRVSSLASWHMRMDATQRPTRQRVHFGNNSAPIFRFMKLGNNGSNSRICVLSANAINFWDCGTVLDDLHSHSNHTNTHFDKLTPAHLDFVGRSGKCEFLDADVLGPRKGSIVYSEQIRMKGRFSKCEVYDVEKAIGRSVSLGPHVCAHTIRCDGDSSGDVFVCGCSSSYYSQRGGNSLQWLDCRRNLLGNITAVTPRYSYAQQRSSAAVQSVHWEHGTPIALRNVTQHLSLLSTSLARGRTSSLKAWDRRNLAQPIWQTEEEEGDSYLYRWFPAYEGNSNAILGVSRGQGVLLSALDGSKKKPFVRFVDSRAHCVTSLAEVSDAVFQRCDEEERVAFLLEVMEWERNDGDVWDVGDLVRVWVDGRELVLVSKWVLVCCGE